MPWVLPKSQEGSEIVRSRIIGLAAALTGTLIVVGGAIAAPHAWTEPAGEQPVAGADDFYLPPASLPAGAGTIVRAEPAQLALSAPGQPGMIPATSTRL